MPTVALVGNDVVDLGDPDARGAHLRERLVQRVLSEPERARLASAGSPHELFWALFAAKEAAYKVVAKIRPGVVFAHRLFEVGPALEDVRYGDLRLPLEVSAAGDCVHALAWTSRAPELSGVATAAPGAALGLAARAALIAAVSRRLGCGAGELSVLRPEVLGGWDGLGPPQILRRGEPLDADVSLSHDGRFVAFAAVHPATGP